MANIASVSYRFDGDASQLETLYETLETVSMMDNEYYDLHIVSILIGINSIEKNYDLRGDIQGIRTIRNSDGSINFIELECECAWGEKSDFRTKVLKPMFKDINAYYYVEETGCGLLESNDVDHKYFSYRYYVEIEDCEVITPTSLSEVKSYIEKNTDLKLCADDDFNTIYKKLSDWCRETKTFTLAEIKYV